MLISVGGNDKSVSLRPCARRMARRRLPCGVRPGRGRRPCLRELALDAAQAHFILLSTIAKAIFCVPRARASRLGRVRGGHDRAIAARGAACAGCGGAGGGAGGQRSKN